MQIDEQSRQRRLTVKAFDPMIIEGSGLWKYWYTIIDGRQCVICVKRHGTIYKKNQEIIPEPPIHGNCRCQIYDMDAIKLGEATIDGKNGADVHISTNNALPNNYITSKEAEMLGWIRTKGNLWDVAPEKIVGGDVFENRSNKLPFAPGRIWYEADINYAGGYRSSHRLVYSNDGLMFVSYDHYGTFFEIV